MGRCTKGDLNSCDEIASVYTRYDNSILDKIKEAYWEQAKIDYIKITDKVTTSYCLNKAVNNLDTIYQKIALLYSEIQSFQSLKG